MKMFKGFDKDLKCRGFQYEVGKTYETDAAQLCQIGFHACEDPMDVLKYYEPGLGSRYCEVELEDVTDESDVDSKRVGKRIRIGAEIGIAGLIKARFELAKETGRYVEAPNAGAATAGDRGAATAGDAGAATAGDRGAATSRGKSIVGKKGVAIARATHPEVSGGLGSVLVLVSEPDSSYDIKHWKAFVIDGEQYQPDTFYTLDESGEVVPCDD